MRYLPRNLRHILMSGVVLLGCIALCACGDWCFSGVINNPNGVIFTSKNASPPPTCPAQTILTTMNVAIAKSQPCKDCSPAVRAEHIFVTLAGIQLHSASTDSSSSPEWIDLAPQLGTQPREIDLLGDSAPLVLVKNAQVAAGTYREVRLQFAPNVDAASGDARATETFCGRNRTNCMLMANGSNEQLYFAEEPPEVVVPLQMNGSNSLAVVPGARLDLQLGLQPQQVSSVSASLGWQAHFTLVGTSSIFR
jgi:Domain of unknown function (DUF4382)